MGGVYCKKCGQPQDGGNISTTHLLEGRRHCRTHSSQIIKLKKPFQRNYLQKPVIVTHEVECCAQCDSEVVSIKDGIRVYNSNCLHDWGHFCYCCWI